MPISDGQLYSFKYVNGHPKNTAQGLLTVTAFGVLADVATGYPRAAVRADVHDCAAHGCDVGARRALHGAAVAAASMALIGNGAQANSRRSPSITCSASASCACSTPISQRPRSSSAISRCCSCLRLRVTRCRSTAEAVQGADIVTTVTADKRNADDPAAADDRAGMHLNAIGGDCPGKTELHGDILRRPDARVVVEFEPQSRIEGEIQQLEPTFPVIEFADVLTARRRRARRDGEVTIFDSVGFALEDFSALRYLHRLHQEERGTKREIDLVPALADPKDLFGELAGRLAARERDQGGARMTTTRAAVLIGAPTDIGASDRGASMGPEALRVAGLQRGAAQPRARSHRPRQSHGPGQSRGCRRRKAIDTSRRSPTGIA